jgi:hypothetical protein
MYGCVFDCNNERIFGFLGEQNSVCSKKMKKEIMEGW